MKRLTSIRLPEPAAEQARQEHAAAIRELQDLPAAAARVIAGVELEDGVVTPVAHGLGRPPAFVQASCPRNPSTSGRIEEVRAGDHDRSRVVALEANGWGATITVDVLVL